MIKSASRNGVTDVPQFGEETLTHKPETGCKSPTDPPASPHPNLKCKYKPTYR